MLRATNYYLDCDICTRIFGENDNQFRLWNDAEAAGWKLRRRKDGERATRGGKDYCPACATETFAASLATVPADAEAVR